MEPITFSNFNAFMPVLGQRKLYKTNYPLTWEIGTKGSGWTLEIEPETTFDISVPRYLEWILNPHDRRILLAALVHDELLKRGHDVAFASSEFRRAAIARGASKFFAWNLFLTTLVWTALKAGKATAK